MKIIDLKCAVIGKNPIVRIVTDEGISGYGEVEQYKPYLKPFILQFREALVGEDPTNVERVMQKIRQRGAFKPYGSAVSVKTALVPRSPDSECNSNSLRMPAMVMCPAWIATAPDFPSKLATPI